jgi:GGDEF domain-containing protein
MISGEPALVAANALPLIRQRAFESLLSRTLRAIEAGGLLDPQSGLLTRAAFERDLASAVAQATSKGGGLSVAQFAFDIGNPRFLLDGARIISRLMRRMDFGAVHNEDSVIVAFAETDLRSAHAICRRLASVMRQTSNGKRSRRAEPTVTVAELLPSDSPASLLARLRGSAQRAAS